MKRVIAILVSFFFALSLTADDKRNGLIAESIDPAGDAEFIQKVREHLDMIREQQGRPTVALVLGGGGAKGAAEVGALKVIDSLKIPIDFVCGTSIGSLVGGIYALGHDVNYIDSLIRHADWDKIMSDKIDQRYYPLHEKKYRYTYVASLPFSYDANGFHAEALPAGYITGQNVKNLFSSVSVGYHDSTSFANLPVPYACVSADLVSSKAIYYNKGVVKTAMRTSMSIPGVFTPVYTDGLVIVDGGIRNNLPTDLARAVGADIIIGIDIQGNTKGYDEVNNIATVLQQLISMLTKANLDELRGKADIFIKPDVAGFTAMSFNAEAIDALSARGYEAAIEKLPELEALAKVTNSASTTYYNHKSVDINKTPVPIKSIMFTGMTNEESRLMHQITSLDITKKISGDDLERAVDMVKASGAVQSVDYSLFGDSEPYDLVFDCVRNQPHKVGVGVRMDSEVWAEIGLNIGINVNKIAGPKFDIDFKLGQSQSIGAKMMLDYPDVPTINFDTRFSNINGDIEPLGYSQKLKMETNYIHQQENLYLSSRHLHAFELKGGFRHNYYRMGSTRLGSVFTNLPKELMSGSYIGAFAVLESYSLDHMYFPTKGVDFRLGANVDFMKSNTPDFLPKYYTNMDLRFAVPIGNYLTLIPDFHYRMLNDRDNKVLNEKGETNLSYSYYHRNFIGGDIQGRYLEHQIPFIGFGNATDCISLKFNDKEEIVGSVAFDHVAVLNLELRASLSKKFYLSALGGYAHMATTFKEFTNFNSADQLNIKAAGLQISYNGMTGPVKFRIQWSDRIQSTSGRMTACLSYGYNF